MVSQKNHYTILTYIEPTEEELEYKAENQRMGNFLKTDDK